MAANREMVIPMVSLVIVGYLENLPRDLNKILSKKFTTITVTAVAKVMIYKETHST